MAKLTRIVAYLNAILTPQNIDDYCPNGLQVEGRAEVEKIVTGVTASQQLIDCAVDQGADLILVHHGYFWKGERPNIIGIKKRRIKTLLAQDLSLLAYHLPLDVHPEYGNNAQLAKILGWNMDEARLINGMPPLVRSAVFNEPMSGDELAAHLTNKLCREPLHIAAKRDIKKVAWCTGAAQSYLQRAVNAGADAFISGEISEQTVHEAKENNIHYFAAGHHATERYGVQALGQKLAEKFALESVFVDCDNPV
jgi:dinuclear metal center YbgI/SA1388 family protein